MNKQLGFVLLGIWLILGALMSLLPRFSFPYEGAVHAILGLLAGVLILMRR